MKSEQLGKSNVEYLAAAFDNDVMGAAFTWDNQTPAWTTSLQMRNPQHPPLQWGTRTPNPTALTLGKN